MQALGICLWLAASPAGTLPAFVPAERFTLAWMHSIEKVRWEEDYTVINSASGGKAPRLRAAEARIRGSGAGMEPPEHAVWRNGWYAYTVPDPPPEGLRLTRSAYTADYELCVRGRCAALSGWLPSDGDVTVLRACRSPGQPREPE